MLLLHILKNLFFHDVTKVMKLAQSQELELTDCENIATVKMQIEQEDQWPRFHDALPSLRQSVLKSIMNWERTSFIFMFLIHLIGVLSAVASSLIAIKILESLGAGQEHMGDAITSALILAILVFLLNVTAATLHSQKIEREVLVFWRVRARLVPYLFRFVTGLSRHGRYNYKTGDILNVGQTDTNTVASFLSDCFVDIPVLIISLFIIMIALYSFLGASSWIPLVVILVQIPLSGLFSWMTSLLFKEYMSRSDRRISLVTEFIQGMRLVRYFGWGQSFRRDIDKTLRSQFRQEMKISAGFCAAFAQSSYWWMIVSLAVVAGLLHFQEGLSPAKVFGGMWLSSILNQQLTPLPWFVSSWASAKVAARRISGLLNEKLQSELIFDTNKSLPKQTITGIGFKFENVSFTFPDSADKTIRDLNLTIPPGSKTAIVGPVGSGKSILSQILLGEIQPDQGRVSLILKTTKEEVDYPLNSKEGLKKLRQHLKWVPQESFVVSASIRENVPLSYQDQWDGWSDNQIMNALQSSQMIHDVNELPQGLNSVLGERGINLSGGQKQRLNISRTHIGEGYVLMLDDPFSAIDKNTEALIAPELFSSDKTLIWVTHRYNFLHHADQVVYLESGQIQSIVAGTDIHSKNSKLGDFLDRTGFKGESI